jgi:hypothetical protein
MEHGSFLETNSCSANQETGNKDLLPYSQQPRLLLTLFLLRDMNNNSTITIKNLHVPGEPIVARHMKFHTSADHNYATDSV